MNAELFADIYEALEQMKKWRPIYESLLKVCKTKKEARDALAFLIKIADEGGIDL